MAAERVGVRFLPGPEATQQAGDAIGRVLPAGTTLTLTGPLGAGKTALAQAILARLVGPGVYPSPTYTILAAYPGPVYHLDLYRIEPEELGELDLDEIFWGTGRAIVEWGERAAALLPEQRIEARLEPRAGGRRLEWWGHGDRGVALARELWARSGLGEPR